MNKVLFFFLFCIPFLSLAQSTEDDTTSFIVGSEFVSWDGEDHVVALGTSTINNLSYRTLRKYNIITNEVLWEKELCRPYYQVNVYNPEHLQKTKDGGNLLITKEYVKATNATSDLLLKTDAEGNIAWRTKLADAAIYLPNRNFYNSRLNMLSIAESARNNFIVAGTGFWFKTDAQGNVLWKKSASEISFKKVIATQDDGYVLIGAIKVSPSIYNDVLVLKIDEDGNELWRSIYDHEGGNDVAYTAVEAENGDIIVGGTVEDSSTERAAGFLKRISPIGATIWSKTEHEAIMSFKIAKAEIQDSYYVTSYDTLYFVNGAGQVLDNVFIGGISTEVSHINVLPTGVKISGIRNGYILRTCYAKTGTNGSFCAISTNIDSDKPLSIKYGETVTLDAGTGFASYKWNTGETSRTITVSQAGQYSVEVTNDAGCSYTTEPVTVTFTCNTHTSITADKPFDIQPGETISLDAGEGFATYKWSTGETTRTIQVTEAGNYNVEVAYDYGCPFTSEWVTVTVRCKASTTITADKPFPIVAGESVTLDAGAGFTTYKWNTGETTQQITVNKAGQYSVEVMNEFGCSYTSEPLSVTLICNFQASITADKATNLCPGETITLDAGAGFTSYRWSTGEKTQTITVSQAGQYSVEVQNEYNCTTTTAPVQITLNAPYNGEQLCYVTVDKATGKNKITWNKTAGKSTVSYNLYKNAVGGSIKVATIPFNAPASIIDENSDPESRAESYFIKAVNQCGNESTASTYHTAVLLQASLGTSGEVNLSWNKYAGATILKTVIYRGPDNNSLTPIAELTGIEDRYIDRNPKSEEKIYRIGIEIDAVCSIDEPGGRLMKPAISVMALSNTLNLGVTGIISKYEKESKLITVWPNPVELDATITIDQSMANPVKLQVFNATGQLVNKQMVAGYTLTLKRNGLPSGLYIVAVTLQDGKTLKKKMVVK